MAERAEREKVLEEGVLFKSPMSLERERARIVERARVVSRSRRRVLRSVSRSRYTEGSRKSTAERASIV